MDIRAGELLNVSWADVEKYIDNVAADINNKGIIPTGVFGPPRGGIVYANLLADKLGIPMIGSHADGCVVIDELIDSGVTLKPYFKGVDTKFGKYYVTTMFAKDKENNGREQADYVGKVVDGRYWINLPQDKNETAYARNKIFGETYVKPKLSTQNVINPDVVNSTKKINVSWEQLEGFVIALRQFCEKNNFFPTGVYGVSNGGEILKVLASDQFIGPNGKQLQILASPTPGCLVVGDKSIKVHEFSSASKPYVSAAMFYTGGHRPDFSMYDRYDKNENNIVFPYTRGEEARKEEMLNQHRTLPEFIQNRIAKENEMLEMRRKAYERGMGI